MLKKEERHKTITILVSYVDSKPRFLTVRDKRHKEWIFVTGGCRKREFSNPLRCALRELEEETRGLIRLLRGEYTYYNFKFNNRSPQEIEQDLQNGLDVTMIYHVYIIEYAVPRSVQLNLIKKFNDERIRTEQRKLKKLPIRRTYDENDIMSFDTLEELNRRNRWDFITNNVLNNPQFYSALNSRNKESFRY